MRLENRFLNVCCVLIGFLPVTAVGAGEGQVKDRIAVVDFEMQGEIGVPDAGKIISRLLLSEFKNKFELVTRTQLESLLREKHLQVTDLMSANKAVEYGKLLPVKFLVVGEVMKGAKYWITAQLVEVGPGIIRSPRKVSAENYLELEEKVPLLGKLLCMTDAEYDKWQAEQEAQAPKGSAAPAPPSPKPQPTAGKEEGKEPGASTQSAMLSPAQRKKLLALARNVIEAAVKGEPLSETNLTDAAAKLGVAREPALLEHCGAFVTIKNHGELRGCIGNFVAHEPLYRVVQKMAYASSTQDSRFFGNQLTSKELRDIDIEISVLSPLQPIADPMKIELGKHGIYIINEKLNRGGCFLPQVATETGWTKEEFLSHCARDKAGLGADAWKNDPDTKVLVFTAEVFGEKE